MKAFHHQVFVAVLTLASSLVEAQVPVTPFASPDALAASADAKLARNKKLVSDFWREVVEAGNIDAADKYVADNYIQHNPNIATGRRALVEQIARNVKRQAVQNRIKAPVVAFVAEGNLVVVALVSELADPADSDKKYTTTWFDMFRIDDGKIVEHWDSALKVVK